MKKLISAAIALAALPVLAFAAPVFADSPGDLAGGADIYQVRNVSQNGSYGSTVSAACDETVKYSVKLSNTDFGQLTNVTVKASLVSGEMTATATTAANGTTSTSGKVTVTVPSNASLSYVAGSTNLYKVDGTLIKNLSDGVTATGVNAGTLAGSTREFVQFQAKVNCPTPPKQIQVCELSTKKVITINENQFDSSKHSKDLTKCQTPPTTPPSTPATPTTPEELPNTGAGQIFGLFAIISIAGAAAHRLFLSRVLSRQ